MVQFRRNADAERDERRDARGVWEEMKQSPTDIASNVKRIPWIAKKDETNEYTQEEDQSTNPLERSASKPNESLPYLVWKQQQVLTPETNKD